MDSFGGPGSDVGSSTSAPAAATTRRRAAGSPRRGDTLYVADTGNDRVQRFTLDGGRGAEIVPPGTLANPRGLAVRGTRLLVADDQHHRDRRLRHRRPLLQRGRRGPGAGPGQLNFPYGVAVDPPGRVFVADDLNHRVVRFSTAADGYPYKARWGSYGTAPGQLAYPRGDRGRRAGQVYVTNTGNDRIDVFDRSGTLLRSFGASGRATGQFNTPLGVAADAAGIRAVTDSVNGRVELLNPDGSIATVWGSPHPGPTILPNPVAVAFDAARQRLRARPAPRADRRLRPRDRPAGAHDRLAGQRPGQLLDPSALAIDAGGTISVADTGNERIARFTHRRQLPRRDDRRRRRRAASPSRPTARAPTSADRRNRITVYEPGRQRDRRVRRHAAASSASSTRRARSRSTPAGNLWVADRGNNRVQEFGPDGERLRRSARAASAPASSSTRPA